MAGSLALFPIAFLYPFKMLLKSLLKAFGDDLVTVIADCGIQAIWNSIKERWKKNHTECFKMDDYLFYDSQLDI